MPQIAKIIPDFLRDIWKSVKSASSAFLNYKESNIYATDDSDLHQIFKRWMEIREISVIRVSKLYGIKCIRHKLSRCPSFLIDGWKSVKSASSAFLNYTNQIYTTDYPLHQILSDIWKSAKLASSAFLNYTESNVCTTDDSDLHQIFKRWMEIREISEIRVIRIPKIMQNQISATDYLDYPRF